MKGTLKPTCRSCGSNEFQPRQFKEENKSQCPTCDHRYFFNDVSGCPECTKKILKQNPNIKVVDSVIFPVATKTFGTLEAKDLKCNGIKSLEDFLTDIKRVL